MKLFMLCAAYNKFGETEREKNLFSLPAAR